MKSIILFMLVSLTLLVEQIKAQHITLNASLLDGVDIKRENLYSYQIMSNLNYSVDAQIQGIITYRNSDLRLSYTFNLKLQPGINMIDPNSIHPIWTYSNTALRDLLFTYNILPAGTYNYCIQVTPKSVSGEVDLGNQIEECVFHLNQELFLINLIDPENNAKIYEHNPAFTWVANYSFSNDLTYKIRVAEIKKGQNIENAIARNNPIYLERDLQNNTLIYPMSAKPLEVYQPYAWTVDAYYHGILLGGAEPWRFTIIEDSLLEPIPKEQSYIEVNLEKGEYPTYAVGQLKIKYLESELRNDELSFKLEDENGKEIKLKEKTWKIHQGENRMVIQFNEEIYLKHLKKYILLVNTSKGKQYKILFKYVNPELI